MNHMRETQKICNITDDVTKIRYKIIYRRSADRFEIWTQFHDESGRLRRNRITFSEAITVESDKDKTIAFVNDYLVANHINIYEDSGYNPKAVKYRHNNESKPVQERKIPNPIFEKHECKDLDQLFTQTSHTEIGDRTLKIQ